MEGGEWGRKNLPKLRMDTDAEKKVHIFQYIWNFYSFFFATISIFRGITLYDEKSASRRTRWGQDGDKMVEV